MLNRQKLTALGAEFLGATILSSVVLSMAGRTSFPFFAAVTAGVVYAGMIMVFGNISKAHFNPVVTVAAWTRQKIDTVTGAMYLAVQLLGGVVAWQYAEYILDQPLQNVAGVEFDWRVLIAEGVGAFIFGLIIAAAISKKFDNNNYAAVTGIGLTAGMMIASLGANGLVNPSTAIGLQSWSWAYTAGPIIGAVVAFAVYDHLFGSIDNPSAKTRVKLAASKVARKTKRTAKTTKSKAKTKR